MNGQSAPHTPSPRPPSPAGSFFDSVRRLGVWRAHDRWAGGVAAGIAQRYGMDPLLVRGIFVVATLFGGLGLVVYGLAWALLPEASDGRIHLEQAVRGHFDIALAGAIAVLIVGLSRPVFWWSASWWAVPWVLVVGVVVAVVLLNRDRDAARNAPAGPHEPPSGGPPQPPYGGGPSQPPYPAGPVPPGGQTPHPAGPVPPAPGGPSPFTGPAAPGTDLAAPATGPTAPGTDLAAPATYAAASPRPAYDVQEDAMTPSTDTTTALPADDDPAHADTGTTAALPVTDTTATFPDATAALGADTTSALPQDPASTTGPPASAAGWDGSGSWDGGWSGNSAAAGSAGGGWGAGAGWDGSQTPPPPKPPVPGPGSRATSLVLAVALLGAAGIALAHHQGVLDANPWLVGGGAVLAVLGAGVLVSGIRGRSQGGIGVLALLLALLVVPAAAAAAALPGFARIGTGATTWAGDPTWAPTRAADAERGYSLVAGELIVDLSALETDADVTVPTSVTFGNLHLIVPDDADVTVNAAVGAGEIVGSLDDDWTGPGVPPWGSTRTDDSLTNGVGISTTLTQEGDGSGPQITIDAEVSFGQLYIEETS